MSVSSLQDVSNYITILNNQNDKNLTLHKFKKAEEEQAQIDFFSRNAKRTLYNQKCQTAISTLKNKLSETQIYTKELNEEANDRLQQFDRNAQERFDFMKLRHRKELEKLDKEKPIETPPKFRRRSPRLLEQYRQERNLIYQRRFDEAKALSKICEKSEKLEQEEAYNQALRHWEIVRAQVLRKHKIAEENMLQWINTRRKEIEKDYENQINAVRRREVNISSEIGSKRKKMKNTAQHAILRDLLFDNTNSRRSTIRMDPQSEIDKAYEKMPQKSREIHLKM
ncbi:hypothetical protein GPJ56_010944 [Histomonas meleagridis]|uniref:uncharacterized protein n=1 Tax=Histomonas meleagridis TaxID=135588 RepID=UPI00355AA448|nr:hypothetical protein GPJ56_010944 [Histomonas meleagridis]KAH0806257.1 hypothetical protein GO595_000945 [Histomonas meleagridis]